MFHAAHINLFVNDAVSCCLYSVLWSSKTTLCILLSIDTSLAGSTLSCIGFDNIWVVLVIQSNCVDAISVVKYMWCFRINLQGFLSSLTGFNVTKTKVNALGLKTYQHSSLLSLLLYASTFCCKWIKKVKHYKKRIWPSKERYST